MNKKYEEQITCMLEALNKVEHALKEYKSGVKDAEYFYFAAEKKAEEVVQTAISVNQDILADFFQEISKSYYDSFIEIEKLGLFSKKELENLAHTTGFRNRLVHGYMNLDRNIVVKSMEQILKLYPKYLKKIMEWLDAAR